MRQRILFVNHTGELGGAELTLLPIAHRYRHQCAVVLLKDGPLRERLEEAGVPVSVLAAGRGMLGVSRQGRVLRSLSAIPAVAAAVWRLARFARAFDVLYANSQKAAVITMLAGAMLRKPVVWYLHDILSAEHFSGLQRRVVVTLANLAARNVIANSSASVDAFIRCGGNPARISIAPSGVDPAPFDLVLAGDTDLVRRQINVQSAPVIGLFGRLTPWKGQHVLVDALANLEGVHGMFVGDPLFGEEAYRADIITRGEMLGIADRLHWLGFRNDIPQLMRACDVVVHTSVSPEPFGRVIVEAMMARRPIIASAHGASRELLGDDYPLLVQPGDAVALATAIRTVLRTGPDEMARLVAENYERACARFSTDRMFADIDRALAA